MKVPDERKTVKCCVKNCQKEVSIERAFFIKDKYFCGVCGTAYYRNALNL